MKEYGPIPEQMGIIKQGGEELVVDPLGADKEEKIWETIRNLPQQQIAFHGTSKSRIEKIFEEGLVKGGSSYFIFDPREFDEENIKESLVALKDSLRYTAQHGREKLLPLNEKALGEAQWDIGTIISKPEYSPALVIALPEHSRKGIPLKDRLLPFSGVQFEEPVKPEEIQAAITLDAGDVAQVKKYFVGGFFNAELKDLLKYELQGLQEDQDPDETIAQLEENPFLSPFLKHNYFKLREAMEKTLMAKAYKFLEQFRG